MSESDQKTPPPPAPVGHCSNCGETHEHSHGPKPLTRTWWVYKAGASGSLLMVPALPLVNGIQDFVTPRASVKLTGAQQDALNSQFELSGKTPTTVTRVTVEMVHPTVWDRLVVAGPSLALAGLLLLLSYALWRIEINMTAGPQQRPFTEKDQKYLSKAARWLWGGWWVLVAFELWGPAVFGLGNKVSAGSLSGGSLIVLGLSFLVSSFARTYRTGREAYTKLDRIV